MRIINDMLDLIVDDIISFIRTDRHEVFVIVGDKLIKYLIREKCVDYYVLEYDNQRINLENYIDKKLVIFTEMNKDIYFSLMESIAGETPVVIVNDNDIYYIENLDLSAIFIDVNYEYRDYFDRLIYKLMMIASNEYWSDLTQTYFDNLPKDLSYEQRNNCNNILRMIN